MLMRVYTFSDKYSFRIYILAISVGASTGDGVFDVEGVDDGVGVMVTVSWGCWGSVF